MKQTLTLLAACAFALNAHAQPTLTFASNAPVIGSQYTLNYGNYVAPGNGGAMQNWDLSGLTSDSTDVLQMVAPSSTTNGDQFPGATVAELSNPVATYYQVNSNGIHFAGSDDGTSLIVNAPMPKYLAFPCSMGSEWSTPHEAEYEYEGETVYRSGTVSGEADGYGTLTMPWGTVDNVLRIHLLNELQDSLSLFTLNYTYDSYLYYVAGQAHPIAELVSATIDFGFGAPEVVQFSRWTGAISTGIDTTPGEVLQLKAYPNPTSDVVNIAVPAAMGANATVTIIDASGRTVHQELLTLTGGGVGQLSVQHLVEGLYTLQVMDGQGQRAITRISKD
jgi:hypothetical protein